MYVSNNNEEGANHCCSGKTITTYSECVSVASVIQHAMRMRRIVICGLPALQYRGAVKSLAQPGRKQATATEDFDFHISYL